MKTSRNFEPNPGDSKTSQCKKFVKCEIYYVTINPKEWITKQA